MTPCFSVPICQRAVPYYDIFSIPKKTFSSYRLPSPVIIGRKPVGFRPQFNYLSMNTAKSYIKGIDSPLRPNFNTFSTAKKTFGNYHFTSIKGKSVPFRPTMDVNVLTENSLINKGCKRLGNFIIRMTKNVLKV